MGQAFVIQIEERQLGGAPGKVVNCTIRVAPVYRKSKPLPERPVVLLDLLTHFQALLYECPAPYLLSSHTQAFLNIALSRKPIIIVAHGVKDIVPLHTPETGEQIGLTIRMDVAEVSVPRYC